MKIWAWVSLATQDFTAYMYTNYLIPTMLTTSLWTPGMQISKEMGESNELAQHFFVFTAIPKFLVIFMNL